MAFEPNPRHAEHLQVPAHILLVLAPAPAQISAPEPFLAPAPAPQGLAATYATCGIKVVVHNHTGVGHKDTTSSFAPFNTLLGHEVSTH